MFLIGAKIIQIITPVIAQASISRSFNYYNA